MSKEIDSLMQALELERAGRRQDMAERGLPHAWVRKCNGKRYGLTQTHVMGGKPMVWLYQEGSNKALHITVERLVRTFRPLDASLNEYQ